MFEGSGSGSSGGGAGSSQMAAMLQGYATQSWVDGNYVSIEFFNRLFRMRGDNETIIVPNDLDTTIQNIEARFGLWTESFLSALGLNSGGGGGGSVSYLNDLLDVSISNPTVGDGLIYDGTRWVNGPIGGGGTGSVESVGLSMPTGFSVTGSPVTSSGTLSVGFASGYSLPPTSKQAQWDAAYSWGDHSQEGYATQSWVNGKGYATQSALTSAVSRITTLEGYFTNGVANQSARLSGSSTYQAWGQTFWQNGTPKSIGSASARANINYAGSVSMGWSLNMEYDDAVHDPSINIKSSKTGTSLSVFMLSNSATSDHSGDHLAIGWGTSAKAQLPIRFFGREFVFNYTTNSMSGGNYSTAEAMRVGYRTLDSLEEPAVYVRKHLMIGDGSGNYFPVTYDYANNALCFSGDIYATGGVSALGFSSTPNGGALISGALEVQSSATLRGNTTIGGTLGVTGATTFGGRVVINNDADDIAIVWNGREYYLNVQAMIDNGFLS